MLRPGSARFSFSNKVSNRPRLRLSKPATRMVTFVLLAAMLTLSVPGPVLASGLRSGAIRSADLVRAEVQLARAVGLLWSQARGQSRGMPRPPGHAPGVKPQAPPSKANREARVNSIRLNTSDKLVLESRQATLFSAIPIDSAGIPIQGLRAEWHSSDQQIVFVDKKGQAVGGKPGATTLIVKAGNASRVVQVTVIAGSGKEFGGKKKENTHRAPRPITRIPEPRSSSRSSAKAGFKRHHESAIRSGGVAGIAPRPMAPPPDPNVDPLPDDETNSLYEPVNSVGKPLGKTRPGANTLAVATEGTETGNKNFTFGLPIVSLPGRGIDVSLDLTYNSLLYNKSTDPFTNSTQLTYDVDSGWPAPGFRIGYGQIEDQGGYGFTLTDPDGTRHALVITSAYNYDTTDGSHIHFTLGSNSNTLFYPDGTRINYGASGGGLRRYPTQITDRNGNYILISYVEGVGPRISSVQDTLERFVTFDYDSNGDLSTITSPGLTNHSAREVMRFFYDDISFDAEALFNSSRVNATMPASARVIKYVFLSNSVEASQPHMGYRFDYSAYGMIYQAVQFRGMTLDSSGASVSAEGTQAAVSTYNYPGTPVNSTTSLNTLPSYTKRTDDWAGRTTSMNGDAPFYEFTVDDTSGISTVTAPDGTISETHTIVHEDNWDHGLISDTYVDKQASSELAHIHIEWEQGPSGIPRVISVRKTNDNHETSATVLSYTSYDNVSEVSERDFTTDGTISPTELRRTKTTYVTSSSYTDRFRVSLPSKVEVFPGSSTTAVSRVDYAYDDYGNNHANLTPRDDIIMHDPAFDPFQQTQETNCHWECVIFDKGHCIEDEYVCDYFNPYDATTDFRGNLTSVTTYPDATSASNSITHATSYDIAGNVIVAQLDCCQQKSFTYSGAGVNGNHDYAYPELVTTGSGSTTLVTQSTYDYNTGLPGSSTDENNQPTTNYYNSDSLRLDHTEYPAGGVTKFEYFDGLTADTSGKYHFYIKTSKKLDAPSQTPRWVENLRYFDGRGSLARVFDHYTELDGWMTRDIEYDVMGRKYRTSNPYFSPGYLSGSVNPEAFWTASTFDHLGRVKTVTMPRGDNNNALTTSLELDYEGVFTTVTDQAAKQRRGKSDALGRLVRVDEPDSSGSLGTNGSPTLATSYEFDSLDNLVHVIQPGPNSVTQHRYFKYDSLSRLIRERAVEHEAYSSYALSDPVNPDGAWSSKFEYNSAGLLSDGYDPRGVHTQFSYDGINRLTQITYSDSTPTAHYFYGPQQLPSGAPSFNHDYSTGRLAAATYGSSESLTGTYYGYDEAGRVITQKQVTGSNTYGLSYSYNLGGMLASETYPSGRTLSYAYDEGARLAQIRDATTIFASGFQYAAHGGLKSENWGNGAVHAIDYNRRLQTSKVTLKQNSSSTSPLQQYDYGYGAFNSSTGSVDTSKNNDQLGKIVSTIGNSIKWTQGFNYDAVGRLSTVAEYQGDMGASVYQQDYTYDRWGNRLQSANTTLGLPAVTASEMVAATNRFVTSGSTPTTYDEAGNVTSDTKFRNLKYEYDANGRQKTVKLLNDTLVQTSIYDCTGMRVQTTASGVSRIMVYDILGHQVGDYLGASAERENIYRGKQVLAVIETPLASPPTSLAAATSGSSSITLNWSAASGATNYRVERRAANGSFVHAGTTPSTSLVDSGVSSGSAYLYRVCTANSLGSCTSSFSNLALGSTVSFTTDSTITGLADDSTGVNVTIVKAAHITELRTAVNAVRTLAGLAAATWTNSTVSSGMPISAADVGDLRTKLDEALALLGIQTSAYDDPSLAGAPSGTLIKKVHITQLRQRATSGAGSQGSGGGAGTIYVLSDAQGSSRAIMNSDGVGASTVIARHDYLPFGEEIGSNLRPGVAGYGAGDSNRKKFGLTERDDLTGLDHTSWRKYENLSGRWTSPDPYLASARLTNPQTLNRYAYVQNDPVNFIDPTGLSCWAIFLIFWQDGKQIGEQLLGVVCDPEHGPTQVPVPFIPVEGGNGASLDPRPATKNQVNDRWLADYKACYDRELEKEVKQFNNDLQRALLDEVVSETVDMGLGTVGLAVGVFSGNGWGALTGAATYLRALKATDKAGQEFGEKWTQKMYQIPDRVQKRCEAETAHYGPEIKRAKR
jgi:RHS repeat-associated protein